MFLNYRVFISISILCLITFQTLFATESCKINLKSDLNKERSPIIVTLDKRGRIPEYVYPTVKDPENIVIPAGQALRVFCPGKTNRKSTKIAEPGALEIYDRKLKPSRPIDIVECLKNEEFKVYTYVDTNNNETVHLKNISCEEISESNSYSAIMRKVKGKCGSAERYEIGYDLGDAGFLKTIDLCHDENHAKTLWAHATIIPVDQEKYRSKGTGRKSFRTGQLYEGMHMASHGPYELKSQFETILTLVDGDSEKAKEYVSTSTKDRKFLAKGHLIANADKFYKSEQDSTYFFANVVPMWQQVNAQPGNWFFVEEYIRHLAFYKDSKLDVWAGGIGILELEEKLNQHGNVGKNSKHVSKNAKLLILDGEIPVPRVLFKCVVDKKNKEGLCFLVVNNPYLSKTQVEKSKDNYIVCEKYNICEKVHSDYNKTKLGYFYCCKLNEFYEKLHEELGLDDLEVYKNYKAMTLITKGKKPIIIQ